MNYQDFINQGYIYIYRGDRYTDVQYKMQPCLPVLTSTGKCIRGKNGNMLVSFQSGICNVLARQLRRLDKLILKMDSKQETTVKQRNKREGNVKESYLPGREGNKKEGFDNRLQQLHSHLSNNIEGGSNPATQTQKKRFKEYLQLSLFPDIVPNYKTTNITTNANNKQTGITKDG
jgi:hypothetical protein